MKQFDQRVAVITGAAGGFGRELALCCAGEGMRVVLADIDEQGLAETAGLLPPGTASLSLKCDVSRAEEVERLAADAYARFGAVHLLFNNAGVACAGPVWAATLEDWQWTLGINLMGVVHGIRSFVPRMLEQGDEGHVVNTASVAGLLSVPASSVYCVSKHGVVTLSECLHHDLRAAGSRIGVSVLCPAYVSTGIADSARRRPAELAATNPLAVAHEERLRKAVRSGKVSARQVAQMTMQAVREGRLYILTHPKIKGAIEMRMRDILDESIPRNPMP
jgi:NAD(P)-dependent dehydrogenase (short-subunit alcohol dehydrogenase family)